MSGVRTVDDGELAERLLLAVLPVGQRERMAKRSRERRRDVARAYLGWAISQQRLDPRLARYSRQVTAKELDMALRVLRSVYAADFSVTLRDVTLAGAMAWADELRYMAQDAERQGRAPTLPLPYLYQFPDELDDYEADEAELATSDGDPSEDAANALGKHGKWAGSWPPDTRTDTRRRGARRAAVAAYFTARESAAAQDSQADDATAATDEASAARRADLSQSDTLRLGHIPGDVRRQRGRQPRNADHGDERGP
jgi:hypothetical protein